MTRKRWGFVAVLLAGLVVLPLFGWSVYRELGSLVLKDHELSPPDWPESLDGLKIALLADLHVGSPRNGVHRMRRLVEETNQTKPDLILIAGDFVIHGVVGGSYVEPEQIGQILSRLSAPLGVFAVLGNHDWWAGPRQVQAALEQGGIPVLDDRGVRLTYRGAPFWLLGFSDFWEGPHLTQQALDMVRDDAPVLAMTHNPDLFPQLPRRIALTLAAHTHGGQVYLPLVGRPIVPSQYGQRYAIGHVVEAGRHLFVTPGVGTSILPIRFRVPPEVSLLHLRAAGSG